MARTHTQIRADFFNVLYTNSTGSAVRAALGAGAASVVDREDLNAASLPVFPFVALQWGVAGGSRTGLRQYFPTWWLYDDAQYRWRRLEALITLIEAAYPEDALSMCHIDFLPVREVIDVPLGHIPGKGFPFQIRTRG